MDRVYHLVISYELNDYFAIGFILNESVEKPYAPYIYALAKRYKNIGYDSYAAKWFVTAAITARIDAARCEDKTAPQGIMIIEAELSEIKKLIIDNKKLYKESIEFALQKEEEFKKRDLPKWICSHGIEAFSGELKYKNEKDWNKERQEIRNKYQEQAMK